MNETRWSLLLLGLMLCRSMAGAQDIVLVANQSVHGTEIRAADLRAIFIGTKSRFADGSHAVPVTLKGGPAHEVFLKNHVGEGPDEFRALWQRAVFTGQGATPRSFDSESALLDYVASTPGAVGYVSRVSPRDKVKSLTAVK